MSVRASLLGIALSIQMPSKEFTLNLNSENKEINKEKYF